MPFDAATPKTRLGDVLDAAERRAFAEAMLADVLDAIEASGGQPEVLSTAPVDVTASVTVDDRPLTTAVNAVLADGTPPIAVMMADLALATPTTIQEFLSTDGDVVLVPGVGGGTNAVLTRTPAFRVDYHGASIQDHRATAADIGAAVREVDSMRLSIDIDERGDLPEVLLHSDGRAADWVAQRFHLATDNGRVGIRRR